MCRHRITASVAAVGLAGFFGSRPFSRANELLSGMGADPIDWRLP
ncbi:uracil-DNA glycosylase domain protein [Mycobacterium kansasii]|uniref:Uracil-DNA glycosylase domain protein n=1 Tax=Mycobacterium kansasii TaxID=1768 RepID=A0A1V3Y0X4_MYCKA|nr:uracil-DNA glycosylase domain protein [Mycobacterium kansasii]